MRHLVSGRKLGRTHSHRKSLLNNLVKSLIIHKQIETTVEKAKETKAKFDRLVSISKKNDVASRREAYKSLGDRSLVKELFDNISPELASKTSGFTRIDKIKFRRGDGAEIALLSIIGFEKFVKEEPATTENKELAKSES
jgi:large subunit ribosomal protein L17